MDRNCQFLSQSVLSDVALRKESVDRNKVALKRVGDGAVALRKESVDRNSLLAIRAALARVALRKESVDRNRETASRVFGAAESLSARRAWIEIVASGSVPSASGGRSPQGERG